ncbi:MAG TPA: ABC transporter substrate-binding protein [Candidatus Nanopelagicales bacterium]
MPPSVRTVLISSALVVGLGLAGCGSGDDGSPSTDTQASAPVVAKDDALAAMVPAAIADDGVLSIGTDASYAPNEFIDTDGTTIIGFDAELATALGQVLGLRSELTNAPFDSLVEGVKNGKYELGVSSFTINADRQEQVDMVSYFNAGTSWAVPKGNPNGITPDDACGRKVAVQKGTVQVDDITARSKACTDAGKQAITIEQYQLQSDATAAVVSGKDDAMLADSPIVAYAITQTGDKLEKVGEMYDAAPYGVAVPKGQGDYTKAIQGAMQQLIDSGAYRQILDAWKVSEGAVTTSEVNPIS